MQVIGGIKIIIPLFTDNVEKSLNFYERIGFENIGDNKLEFKNTKTQLNIYKSFNEKTSEIIGKQSADIFFFSIEIDDIDSYKQYLDYNKISIEDIQSPPIGEYLYLRDPNGNRICVYKNYLNNNNTLD